MIICNTRWYYISKLTDFENKTTENDVDALVQKFLAQMLPAIQYFVLLFLHTITQSQLFQLDKKLANFVLPLINCISHLKIIF